jgi:competence protein ComEA
MKDLWKIIFSVLFTLLAVGLIILVSGEPRGQPIQLTPPPSPGPLTVHVAGAVQKPGVYSLPVHSRLQDAILAAGGFSPLADPHSLNLAAFVEDSSRIDVPTMTVPTFTPLTSPAAGTDPAPSLTATEPVETPSPKPVFPIDINTASQLELEVLPQIGPVRAARIISYRQSHGLFKRIEDIRNVYDISPEVYAAIRDLITVSGTAVEPTSRLSPTAP